jgi:Putative lipoprotein LpqV
MNRHPLATAATLATAAIAALSGCSSSPDGGPTSPASPAPTTTSSETPTAAPGEVAVSPDGVTTAVGTPAESTEEEYFQACRAAREWMNQQGGEPKSQIEPYLQTVQSSDSAGPGTFNTPWSQLEPARQSAVIVAVQAAADELCG